MRIILFLIIVLIFVDSAYSRSPFDTDFIYTNSDVNVDGSPTVSKVVQWSSGTTATTTVDVTVRTCVMLTKENLVISFIKQGPNNLLKVKSLVRPTACSSPQIQNFSLFSSTIPPIELADIKVNKKRIVLWVYSNRLPYGYGG